jgi:hypothetical protein
VRGNKFRGKPYDDLAIFFGENEIEIRFYSNGGRSSKSYSDIRRSPRKFTGKKE